LVYPSEVWPYEALGRGLAKPFAKGKKLRGRESEGTRPFNDQGIFISIVVPDDACDSKSHTEIEGLGPLVALSYLCPDILKARSVQYLFKEFFSNSFSSMLRVDRDGDDVAILRENDVTPDLLLSILSLACIDQKVFRVEGVEIDEGGPIVRRFGKGLLFDLKDLFQIRERERPNHQGLFVPAMIEAMPKVKLREFTFFSPDLRIISS
jgi:hypothetical protein